MITAYALVAMWFAFVAGGSTNEAIHELTEQKPEKIYTITVDYNSGQTKSVCQEEVLINDN